MNYSICFYSIVILKTIEMKQCSKGTSLSLQLDHMPLVTKGHSGVHIASLEKYSR